jgi:hypothetical protein
VFSVDVCSAPNAFSKPCSAGWYCTGTVLMPAELIENCAHFIYGCGGMNPAPQFRS